MNDVSMAKLSCEDITLVNEVAGDSIEAFVYERLS